MKVEGFSLNLLTSILDTLVKGYMAENKPLLEILNVSKSFPGVQALSDVSLDVHSGEVVAVVGENGAGKSTLMNILCGRIPANQYQGEITLDGNLAKFTSPRDAKVIGIEMVHQEISLHYDLSVAENILLGKLPRTKLSTISWKKIYQEAAEALTYLDLNLDLSCPVRRLGTSQQQLIAITRAIINNPRILILDEPTSALTEKEANKLLSKIRELKEKGISCLYISHKLDEVFSIADKIMVLRDGFLISKNQCCDIEHHEVVHDMVGREITNFYPKEKATFGDEVMRIDNLTIPHPHIESKKILDDISFSIREGEVLGIAGLVGSGRTELLNAIFGNITEWESGKIFIDGDEVNIKNPRTAKNNNLGYVTENRKESGLVGSMDITKNISLASLKKVLRGYVISFGRELTLTDEYTRKLAIRTSSYRTNVLNLSGGNQQKVVLAKWLSTKPKILLLDEPTKGIDVGAKIDLYKTINKLVAQGVAILFVSSEMPELLAMSDRILVLANGRFVGEFKGGEATQKDIMSSITNKNNNYH